jgi:formyltetrahydrofolate synthetase
MDLDPRQMQDWEIAEAAEDQMKPIQQLAAEFGLRGDELIPYGYKLGKVDYQKVLARLQNAPIGKYVDVTAITPTPLGEGKTTTTIGLIEGLGRLGQRVCGAIRQPSSAPTFNIKGSAAGGGLAQCVPLTPISIRLTGDLDCVTNAHNLAMVALTSRLQHEHNYDDTRLAQSGLKRLDIDPSRIQISWTVDFCAQALRKIRIGLGGKMDGFEMDSGFQMTMASEVMAILAVARDLRDLRERISRMVVAYSRSGQDVTTADLEVDGAMTAWLIDAIKPNLVQTIEGQPVFIHAGPFANIAIGQSSILADRLGTKLADYHVTESGFAADIGYEKFWNLKCRMSGLKPDAVVIVVTIRALKMHGGGPAVKPGMHLDPAYTTENVGLVEKGCENLAAHIDIVTKSGVRPIVCLNHFKTDTEAEILAVRRRAEAQGAKAVTSRHWLKGGAGAVELAEAVMEGCRQKNDFHFLYNLGMPLRQRIELIAREIYGAEGVTYTENARAKLEVLEAKSLGVMLGTCMAKTQQSLSHDPELKGRPRGWTLPINDILVYKGAGFIVPVAGQIKLMPGTGSDPAFRRIDVDVDTGRVKGLF